MTDSMRDRLRDELTGWPINSGYYSTAVSVDDARDMADAVLAILADPGEDVIERAARYTLSQGYGCEDCFEHVCDPGYDTCNQCAALGREFARELFRAAFGGEQK